MVKLLLEAGAPTGTTCEYDETRGNALTLAIAMHNRECVKVFLETANDKQFWDAMGADDVCVSDKEPTIHK